MMLSGCATWPEEFATRYRQEGCWQGETFGAMLRQRAANFGDRIAIVSGDQRISYAELDDKADRLAAGFRRLGIKAQDRVIVQLPNILNFLKSFLLCFASVHYLSSPCRYTAKSRSLTYVRSRRLLPM